MIVNPEFRDSASNAFGGHELLEQATAVGLELWFLEIGRRAAVAQFPLLDRPESPDSLHERRRDRSEAQYCQTSRPSGLGADESGEIP